MPQLDLAFFPSQILWLVVAFTLLYALMILVVVPTLDHIFSTRQDLFGKNTSVADQVGVDIELLKKQREQEISETRQQVECVHSDMMAKFNAQKQEKLSVLDKKCSAMYDSQNHDIAQTRIRIEGVMKDAVTDAAVIFIKRVTGVDPDLNTLQNCYNSIKSGSCDR